MTGGAIFLTLDEVLVLHAMAVKLYGGEGGIRDESLLLSALAMPESGVGGELFHPGPYEMAAAYLFHIVMNHPFIDGNKRTGIAAAITFLDMNGIEIACGNDELTEMVLSVARGELGKDGAAAFFASAPKTFRNPK